MSLSYCPTCGKIGEQDGNTPYVICPTHGRVHQPPFDDMGATDEMSYENQRMKPVVAAAQAYVHSERFLADLDALRRAIAKYEGVDI